MGALLGAVPLPSFARRPALVPRDTNKLAELAAERTTKKVYRELPGWIEAELIGRKCAAHHNVACLRSVSPAIRSIIEDHRQRDRVGVVDRLRDSLIDRLMNGGEP